MMLITSFKTMDVLMVVRIIMVLLLVILQYSQRSPATCLPVGSLKRRNTASVLTRNMTIITIGTKCTYHMTLKIPFNSTG